MVTPELWYQDLPLWDRVRHIVRRYLLILRPWEVPDVGQPPGGGVAYGLAERLLGRGWTEQMISVLADIDHQLQALREVDPETLTPRSARAWRRWRELVIACGLDPWEEDALAVVACGELIPEVQKWYQISLASSRESLPYHFLKGLIDPSGEYALEVEHALSPAGTLAQFQLLYRSANPIAEEGGYRVAPAVLAFLRESRGDTGYRLEAHMGSALTIEPRAAHAQAPWFGDLADIGWDNADTVARRVAIAERGERQLVVFAPRGWGSLTLARVMAHRTRRPVVILDFAKLPERTPPEVALGIARREARLSGGILYIENLEILPQGSAEAIARLIHMLSTLEGEPDPRVIRLGLSVSRALASALVDRTSATDRPVDRTRRTGGPVDRTRRTGGPLERTSATGAIPITLPSLSPDARRGLWQRSLASAGIDLGDSLLFLVRAYNLGVEQIAQATRLALGLARRRALDAPRVTLADLQAACRQQSDHALRQIATAVTVSATWDDVILDEDTQDAVREIVLFGKHQRKVLDDWGYGKSMAYGRALTAMFTGPSGTGKTMVAGLIAQELGCELYRADLAQLVSKYIGETEERLSHLFDEAEATGAALFFDEADSLFGKRTDVKSATDRYANLEVNYLLQRIETFSGVVILASNFPKSIDDAFQRRIRFKVEFHRPDEDQRLLLWQVMIPTGAPREDELELDRLAGRFDLTGGEIRNAVIRAAMYAAEADAPLSFQHLTRAVEQEYRNSGRLVPRMA